MNIIILLLISYLSCINTQEIFNNPCRKRPIQQNFDLRKYVAQKWYEISRFEASFEKYCNCGHATYTLETDNTVGVKNCCKRPDGNTCSIGKAILAEPNHVPLEGKLKVSFGPPPNNTNYYILSTDYENYSIVYYCRNIPDDKSIEFAWLLSSKPQLDNSVKLSVDNLMTKYFETSRLYVVNQTEEFCAPREQ